jgi:mono/diheme cytochrome c family protein
MVSRRKMGIALTVVALAFVGALLVLSLYGGTDPYTPTTDAPEVIFHEACARCHNERGAGGRGIGPRHAGEHVDPAKVRKYVQGGKGRMPRFPNIPGPALDKLVVYVNGL